VSRDFHMLPHSPLRWSNLSEWHTTFTSPDSTHALTRAVLLYKAPADSSPNPKPLHQHPQTIHLSEYPTQQPTTPLNNQQIPHEQFCPLHLEIIHLPTCCASTSTSHTNSTRHAYLGYSLCCCSCQACSSQRYRGSRSRHNSKRQGNGCYKDYDCHQGYFDQDGYQEC
jgi:hypothetical protein